MAWCDLHKDWTEEDWLKVEYSNESTFSQFRSCSEIVRRPMGERFNPSFTKKTVKQPLPSWSGKILLGVWGGGEFSSFKRGSPLTPPVTRRFCSTI